MNKVRQGLYLGHVVHQRMMPVTHKLRYFVFSCLFDLDKIGETSRQLRWFSHNRFNLFSLRDRDFGDGGDINEYAHQVARQSGIRDQINRFMMLCYPRILGYGFNPITVFYGLDDDENIKLMIYEVRNTFGEKTTYVIPAQMEENNIVAQQCDKQFFVSPFNKVEGQYQFRITAPLQELTLGVLLKSQKGGVLRAHFRGTYHPLDDTNLLSAFMKTGWMTAKVTAGIHYEALKLWFKGMRLKPRPKNPPQITFVDTKPDMAASKGRKT